MHVETAINELQSEVAALTTRELLAKVERARWLVDESRKLAEILDGVLEDVAELKHARNAITDWLEELEHRMNVVAPKDEKLPKRGSMLPTATLDQPAPPTQDEDRAVHTIGGGT